MTKVGGAPDWAPSSLWCGPFQERDQGLLWLRGFATRPGPLGILVVGPDVYPFLGQFDEVILQAWPDDAFLRRVRDASARSSGTRVGLWCNYESVRADEREIEERQKLVWNVSRSRPLLNPDGSPFVPWPGAISIDTRDTGLAKAWVSALESTMENYYRHARPDRFFFDCHGSKRYPPFEGETEITYRVGWNRLDDEMVRSGSISGHNPEERDYRLGMRIHEHYFRVFSQTIRDDVMGQAIATDLAGRKPSCAIGGEARDWPAKPHEVLRSAEQHYTGTEYVYIVAARSGAAFGLWGLPGVLN